MTRLSRVAAMACALALAAVLTACSAGPADLELPAQADAALSDDTQAQLQAAVDQAVAASGATGAVVGVWIPWSGSWLAGVGTTTTTGPDVAATSTFKAGAVTRAMTCDALYAVADRGLVELTDPVGDYVAGIPGYEQLTLEELCDSTSGLQSYAPLLTARMIANPARPWAPRELLAYGMSRGLSGEPGATFSDADTGYVLLGQALEHATGASMAEVYDEYVFTPMGLTVTALPTTADVQLNGLWSPSAEDGSVMCAEPTDVTALSPSAGYSASGVATNLTDLGRYTQAVAVGARSFDTDTRYENPLPVAADGPSWFTADGGLYQAGTLLGQYGSMPGYLTAAFADRDTGMTVVVVLNNSRASSALVRSLAWQLAAIASKAPAAEGETAPEAGLPWTADDMSAQVVAAAVCPLQAEEPADG
ncbi:serine hydrolase domain-containing protein [Microbacterium sp.]|uniref:serine hydrolase domain-containing protein n=1 Tax=Microbacterium sp. TaxID=51671 RepID=UPI0039E22BFA